MNNLFYLSAKYEDNWLYIGSSFDNYNLRIGSWKRNILCEEFDYINREWVILDAPLDLDLFNNWNNDSFNKLAVLKWEASLPTWVTNISEQFDFGVLIIISLLNEYPAAKDIFYSCPALILLLVEYLLDKDIGMQKGSELLQMKRRELLKELSLENSKAVVKLLAKINVGQFDKKEAGEVKKFISNKDKYNQYQMLSTVKQIPSKHISFLSSIFSSIKYPSIMNTLVINLDDNRSSFYIQSKMNASKIVLEDTRKMLLEMRMETSVPHLLSLHTENELKTYHDNILQRYLGRQVRPQRIAPTPPPSHDNFLDIKEKTKYQINALPTPLLEGNDVIIPITKKSELVKEGQIMRNCVGSYTYDIRNRKCDIYKVLAPQRATLEIRHLKKSSKIGQLLQASNSPVSSVTRRVVEEWFKRESFKSKAQRVKEEEEKNTLLNH